METVIAIVEKRYRRLLWAVGILLVPGFSFAQADVHFSQFYETSILRNPAMTGVFADDYKFGGYYRSQWSSISNPFQTAMISAEAHLPISAMSTDFFSFGLLGYSDHAGSINQKITGIYPAVNYNKSINPDHNSYLSIGFTGGHLQYSFDPGKATFNNQYYGGHYDPSLPSLENLPAAQMSLWDLGAGINFNTSTGAGNNTTYIIGFSGYHFTQPKFTYYQVDGITQNMRFNGNVAMSTNITEDVAFQVHGNIAFQGSYKEIMLGGLVSWSKQLAGPQNVFTLTGGAFYRYKDAVIPVVKVKYNYWALGFSYDVNTSPLKDASNMDGGYEITLFVSGNFTDKGITKKLVCPHF
jgi:type IX secretion system PorP/SprF family membrane protein